MGVGGSIWARVTSLARIEPRAAGQLGSAAPLAHSLSRSVGVQVDVDVSSHAWDEAESQAPGNPMWMGEAREKGMSYGLRERHREKQRGGWASLSSGLRGQVDEGLAPTGKFG